MKSIHSLQTSTDTSECAVSRNADGTCLSKSFLEYVKPFRPLECTTELCILQHPSIRALIRPTRLKAEERRFKPFGPDECCALLSNFNIDDVLVGWAATFETFYNYPYCMMDFENVGGSLVYNDVLSILKGEAPQRTANGIVRRVCDTFACVLNTDISSGKGKHWVALFGDCRGEVWSISFFNSSGNPPPAPLLRWMYASCDMLRTINTNTSINLLSNIRHQTSQTECGVYSLYFIRRCLEGGSLDDFSSKHIPDELMATFRKHLFRS